MSRIDLADGTYTAVVDAIEDGLATVFFERDGDDVGDAVLDADRLPDEGRHADAILDVRIEDGSIATATYDPDLTESRSEAAQDRFDRLSERPPKDGRE
ncbi:DUF3006 family protein [Halorubrum sp. CBA1229]|uniref:DUF3006 family protein n=1 Tax=Halorubrum sp. CBA1229 TaxID=1853699 RepID=UPI000F407414|nr:DUF3006 family protein [Halorubrum sp. CBA1229]QKY17510.1 DUF3006 domain-containing protein [Halorubrum sp. CBA1229]